MTGQDLLEALQKLTPEQLALPVECSYIYNHDGSDVESSKHIERLYVTEYQPCITLE